MRSPEPTGRIVRFGSFALDLQEGTLTKAGLPVRLQGQPFRILTLLLERPGQLVTREEIRERLWAQDTFVEFDDALNTAVGKLRVALNDSADTPRFLETVPRRGYRFVAPVTLPPVTLPPSHPLETNPTGAPFKPSFGLSGAVPLQIQAAPPPHGSTGVGRPGRRRSATLITVALLMATALVIYRQARRPLFQITPKDTIVLADFVNTTGEAVFEDALRQGLVVGIEQSPFVKVLSDRKTAVVFKQMGHSPDERITGRTALDLCRRVGGKVTVQGSIASLGTSYLIGLAAIRCENGEPIANEQVQARSKEDVVDALGQATAHLRARLGESLPSIQKYNAPLEQATTASLDALNAYGIALSTWDRKGDLESLPLFKKVTELDSNFAMAYGALATIYHNLGESGLARDNAAKAYALRNRVTESERAILDARYYSYVTGELDKAAQVHVLEIEHFPDSASSYSHLATDDGKLGRYEQSVENFRKALLLDPTRSNSYASLAGGLLALERTQDAAAVLAEAQQRKLQTDALLQANYWLAFFRDDSAEMQHAIQQSADVPAAQSLLLAEQSDTEAYHGHFRKARELSPAAANLMQHDGDKESAALCLALAAVREAEVGRPVYARELLARAEKLSRGQDVVTLAALVMSKIGDVKQAEALVSQLNQEWPVGTYVQKYWLPTIRAEIDLRQGHALKAIDDLAVVVPPLEYAAPPTLPVATLYPAFVRGQAYLAAGNAQKALVEFQKLTANPGMVLNYPLAALAHLELARTYHATGDREKSRQAYQDFLGLWKDADPDIPILKQAKAEYTKLQ